MLLVGFIGTTADLLMKLRLFGFFLPSTRWRIASLTSGWVGFELQKKSLLRVLSFWARHPRDGPNSLAKKTVDPDKPDYGKVRTNANLSCKTSTGTWHVQ